MRDRIQYCQQNPIQIFANLIIPEPEHRIAPILQPLVPFLIFFILGMLRTVSFDD